MAKKKLVVANWKTYVESAEEAKRFAQGLRRKSRLFSGTDVVLAPSFPLLPLVAGALKGSPLKVGAQSVSPFESGAHTGAVTAATLRDIGVSHVIVGHSERRARGEGEEDIRLQVERAQAARLTPILCVGERERDATGSQFSLIESQLRAALRGSSKKATPLAVAYEPVWAIGRTAQDAMKPAEVREMSIFIKKTLAELFGRTQAMRAAILYGGSVEGENARALIEEGNVDGFLVGHASAVLDSFLAILSSIRALPWKE